MDELKTNVLYYGDNLEILRKYISDNSIDLIYLDPPFSSNRDYNILYKERSGKWSEAQVKAFSDTWHWGDVTEDTFQDIKLNAPLKVSKLIEAMVDGIGQDNDVMAYIVMMTLRLLEMRRVLKDTGSLYLHCDPAASHYLKLVLDQILGPRNFQNEIVWCYEGRELSKTRWNRKHDTIFLYTKGKKWTFNWQPIMEPLRESSREALARYEDEQGRKFILRYKKGGGFAPIEKEGSDTYRQYVPEGVPPRDWVIIDYARKSERMGYETQKPLALLERIIKASSNEGDIILDPFCGCGTALVAAHKLNRRWIGIDITYIAIEVMSKRLRDSFPGIQFETEGLPKDLNGAKALAHKSRTQFELWALGLVGARSVGKRDGGVDGVIEFQEEAKNWARIAVQVKSGAVNPGLIRDLEGVLANKNYAMGIFITLNPPTGGMKDEARKAGRYHHPFINLDYPKIQILTIDELLRDEKPEIPPTKVEALPKTPRVSKKEAEQLRNL